MEVDDEYVRTKGWKVSTLYHPKTMYANRLTAYQWHFREQLVFVEAEDLFSEHEYESRRPFQNQRRLQTAHVWRQGGLLKIQ